jgi:hypothetical protein
MALAGTIILAGLGGCAVTDVEAAWQSTHFARSPDIAEWSRGMEQTVKGWFPGIRTIPEVYASRVN